MVRCHSLFERKGGVILVADIDTSKVDTHLNNLLVMEGLNVDSKM